MATSTATRVSAPPSAPTDGTPRKRRPVEPIYYLFLLPALVLFSLAITLPAIMGIFYSFTNSIGFGEWEFVGLINYQAMFSDPAIWQSYLFTFGFAAATVVVVNVIAFLLAVGLTAKIRLKSGLRAIFVIPMVISGIIIAYVFNYLFSNSVPNAGSALGISWLSESILANPDLAWVAIVIVTAWQAIPGTLLIYIAGLLSIPEDVYEAADTQSHWSISVVPSWSTVHPPDGTAVLVGNTRTGMAPRSLPSTSMRSVTCTGAGSYVVTQALRLLRRRPAP